MTLLADAVGLLERAIGYALGSIAAVTPQLLPRPTPCPRWDLRALLRHLDDSLGALYEGIDTGRVGLFGVDAPPGPDLVATFRDRAGQLLAAWTAAGPRDRVIAIAGCPLPASLVASTGAIEIAAHGWDVARACGQHRPIPPTLAVDLLTIARPLVPEATRHPRFAAPVAVRPGAAPGDRLVAFLGRRPDGG